MPAEIESLLVRVTGAGLVTHLELVHQTKKGYVQPEATEGDDLVYRVPLAWKDGRWAGQSVHMYGDKRAFVYLTWLDSKGAINSRIKLFQEQVPAGADRVTVRGIRPGGQPACSTATCVF